MATPITLNITPATLAANPEIGLLVKALSEIHVNDLGSVVLYHDFPIFRDENNELLRSQVAMLGSNFGLVLLAATSTRDAGELIRVDERLDRVYNHLYSRLLRTKSLQQTRQQLAVPVTGIIFAPNVPDNVGAKLQNETVSNARELKAALQNIAVRPSLPAQVMLDLQATFQGARGIVRPKARVSVPSANPSDLVEVFNRLETEMAGFDLHQARSFVEDISGPQRIRGLAGSGKTVVLAMKAALTHLRYPQARVLYTFHTKSLYQHVKRTITRFYREFDDRDPDWDRITIQHSWGGARSAGVYYEASVTSGLIPLNLREAQALDINDPLGAACTSLLMSAKLEPYYDYSFVDEAQDFAPSFLRLCGEITRDRKMVVAADELQTIFRPTMATAAEIWGNKPSTNDSVIEFSPDIILPVCYRNPREILVVAHAIGLGIYGNLVQMLEDEEHWERIGYRVAPGSLQPGQSVSIHRPKENSLATVSSAMPASEIIQAGSFEDYRKECEWVANDIRSKIELGLRPDDMMVVVVDDRAAKRYLDLIETMLREFEIASNNIHSDSFGVPDFFVNDSVTLSTVHKAKGNEAMVVYVVGADAVFGWLPTVRDRNKLFTAFTRAKALVRITGVGESANKLKAEIDTALKNFPNLNFTYPPPGRIQQIRKDWTKTEATKSRVQAEIDRLLAEVDENDLVELLRQRAKSINKRARPE